MKMLLAIIALALSACASTPDKISGLAPGVAVPIVNSTIATDLQDAAWNADQAIAVGALDANDPASKCLHDILVKAGIEVAPGAAAPASFTPRNSGVASGGMIVYILAQQAKKIAATGVPVSVECEALVGRVAIDGAKAVNKTAVSLIPGLIK
jgi:hypothetical protein